jgi:hypothetical protein
MTPEYLEDVIEVKDDVRVQFKETGFGRGDWITLLRTNRCSLQTEAHGQNVDLIRPPPPFPLERKLCYKRKVLITHKEVK